MGGADQRPLCLHGVKAAQQELSKSSCLLDLPEHRLHDLLSQSVPAAITGALQLLPHFLRHLAADLARGLGRMLGSPGSDVGVDRRERQQIVLTAIARVRRNLPALASEVGPDGISFLLMPEILQTDDLVALVPSRLLRDNNKRLVVLKPPVEVPGFDVIAVWHPRVDKDIAHRWLRSRLAETSKIPRDGGDVPQGPCHAN